MIIRYYWCVVCGYHGDFKQARMRGLNCESCGYEDLTKLEKDEYLETNDHQRTKLNDFKRLETESAKKE